MENVYKLLGESILSTDRRILYVAIAEFACFVAIVVLRKVVLDERKDTENCNIEELKKHSYYASRVHYVFLTILSIFPLLGMLGTVFGLLGLDLTNGDMSNIRDNFFIALTSTAWGIIFSMIFKVLDAIFLEDVERINESVKSL